MAKNTGKASEDAFENRLLSLGKAAYFYRFKDASDIRGLTGKIGHIDKQPSDYILVLNGSTEFAEVKSSQNPTSFPFSLIKTGQSAHGLRVLAAGGTYNVYVHQLLTDRWFVIPLWVINATKSQGKSSIPWTELERYSW